MFSVARLRKSHSACYVHTMSALIDWDAADSVLQETNGGFSLITPMPMEAPKPTETTAPSHLAVNGAVEITGPVTINGAVNCSALRWLNIGLACYLLVAITLASRRLA